MCCTWLWHRNLSIHVEDGLQRSEEIVSSRSVPFNATIIIIIAITLHVAGTLSHRKKNQDGTFTIFLLPPFLLHSHGPCPTPLPSSPQLHLIWDDEHPSFHTWTQKAGLCFSVMDALLSQQTARLFWVVQAGLPHQFLLPVNTHIDNYLYLLTDNYLYLLTDNYLYLLTDNYLYLLTASHTNFSYLYLLTDNYLYLLTASHTNFSYLYLLTDNYLYLLTACHTNFSWQLSVSANSLPHKLLTTTCIC